LGLKSYVAEDLDIDNSTQEMAALATYAEYYNGLGYSYRDKPSPYVWSGTDQYKRGKYVSDGRYSAWAKDGQLGVVVMIQGIRALEAAPVASAM
jgi:lysozyme family protein